MGNQALSGLKVIDLSWHIAGPYCTKLLADMGADVIKVERPEKGDPSRWEGPFPNDELDLNASGLFGYLNNNKRGLTLNLQTGQGKEMIKTLVSEADILVENFSPGVMERLGLGYKELKSINPRLIMTSISNFGQQGKYRNMKATEMITAAMSGHMGQIGESDREPVRAAGSLRMLEYIAGTFAAMSTMAEIVGRKPGGAGKHLDISITECGALLISYRTVQNSYPTVPAKYIERYMMIPSVEKCKDGYIGISLLHGRHWQDFCYMTEMYDWAEDPRFMDLFKRIEHKEEFKARLDPWLMAHTKEEIFKLGSEWRVPITDVPSFEEMLSIPQYKERNFFIQVDHPVMGSVMQPGAPYRMSESPWRINYPAPLLGEHNEEIYKNRLGFSDEKIALYQKEGII
ncbi:CaiB/BaiF CoA transferase family protein [Bacillus testis]|uniref:CaiB/BaiF CoA transferase family protein n=1 Tax=Bacillus testis TaxID=1622072 RepID=UPI00067F611C|nr:CoA transferase [Bacillus testis]